MKVFFKRWSVLMRIKMRRGRWRQIKNCGGGKLHGGDGGEEMVVKTENT